MPAKKKETSLAKVADVSIAEFAISEFEPGELAETMQENFGGENLTPRDLERIKIPAGGSKLWIVPSLDDEDGEAQKELQGVIVAQRKTRVYWENDLGNGESGPPDCYSTDGKVGNGNEGPVSPTCADCPMNQFGSKEGKKGKACKEVQELYLLQKENVLPVVLPLPPTSGAVFKRHKIKLMNRGKKVPSRLFTFGLESVDNADKIKYSRATVKSEPLPDDVHEAMADYARNFKEMLGDKPPIAATDNVVDGD
jgi:hypothetical protein